jgi:hypothetical protein
MYLVGAAHPHKVDAQRLLEAAVARGDKLVTDVEAFQEILHRYVAIDRRDAIQPAFDALHGVVDDVFAIGADDIERAKAIVLERHLADPVLRPRLRRPAGRRPTALTDLGRGPYNPAAIRTPGLKTRGSIRWSARASV